MQKLCYNSRKNAYIVVYRVVCMYLVRPYIWPCTVAGNVSLFVSHLCDAIVYFHVTSTVSGRALISTSATQTCYSIQRTHSSRTKYTQAYIYIYVCMYARARTFPSYVHWAQANAAENLRTSTHACTHTHTQMHADSAMISLNRKEKRNQHIHPVGSTIGCGLEAHFMTLISWNINRRMLAPIDLSLKLHGCDWNKCRSHAVKRFFVYKSSIRRGEMLV